MAHNLICPKNDEFSHIYFYTPTIGQITDHSPEYRYAKFPPWHQTLFLAMYFMLILHVKKYALPNRRNCTKFFYSVHWLIVLSALNTCKFCSHFWMLFLVRVLSRGPRLCEPHPHSVVCALAHPLGHGRLPIASICVCVWKMGTSPKTSFFRCQSRVAPAFFLT